MRIGDRSGEVVLTMPLLARERVRGAGRNCMQDIRGDIVAGKRAFLMTDIWLKSSACQRFRISLAYVLNVSFAVLKPIAALLFSEIVQWTASHQESVNLFGVDLKPSVALLVVLGVTGLDNYSEYIKTLVMRGIVVGIEYEQVRHFLTVHHSLAHEEHEYLQEDAEQILADSIGAYRAIQSSSVSNLQPALFNLLVASATSFFVTDKALSWLVIPYVVAALLVKSVLQCCVKEKAKQAVVSNNELLRRLRPSYGKTAMMYDNGRQNFEVNRTLEEYQDAVKHDGTPKWFADYKFLINIISCVVAVYYALAVFNDDSLKPEKVSQVTYMWTYLALLLNSFSTFGQSVGTVSAQFNNLDRLTAFTHRMESFQTHVASPKRGNASYSLQLSQVSYHYPDDTTQVISGFDLSVGPGELVCIVGQTGCGKSTLAKLMAGLNDPVSGDVFVAGQSFRGMTKKDRAMAVAYVPQTLKQQTNKSVLYHMIYVLCDDDLLAQARGMNSEAIPDMLANTDIYSRARDALARCGLSEALMHRKVSTLSAGQRYMLSLAMAIVQDARVLIIDQMFGNFDPPTAQQLRNLVNDLGVARVVITDDPQFFPSARRVELGGAAEFKPTPQ